MARPTKYTPQCVTALTEAIQLGATYELACAYAGISFQTFNAWRKAKPAFSEAVQKAEGTAAVAWLRVIESAAINSWQAAAWKLERRYPQDYGRRVQEHQGATAQPLVVERVVFAEAERIANVLGLEVAEVLAEAERITHR